jgi:hypothetical protein
MLINMFAKKLLSSGRVFYYWLILARSNIEIEYKNPQAIEN